MIAHGTKLLKLKYDEPLSKFAFNFNLRRYSKDIVLKSYACPADLEVFGMDRVKEELMKHGLKCGGTLTVRSGR